MTSDLPVVLVVGDSFAGMYLQVMQELSEHHGREVWFNQEPNSGVYDSVLAAVRSGRVGDVVICYSWRRALQGGIPELSPGENEQRLLDERLGFVSRLLSTDREGRFEKDLVSLVEQIHRLGARVWLVDAPPYYPTHVPLKIALMLQRGIDPTSFGNSLASHGNELRPVHDVFERIERLGNAKVIWTASVLADEDGRCRTWMDGRCLYSDDAHLSYEGASIVKKSLEMAFVAAP